MRRRRRLSSSTVTPMVRVVIATTAAKAAPAAAVATAHPVRKSGAQTDEQRDRSRHRRLLLSLSLARRCLPPLHALHPLRHSHSHSLAWLSILQPPARADAATSRRNPRSVVERLIRFDRHPLSQHSHDHSCWNPFSPPLQTHPWPWPSMHPSVGRMHRAERQQRQQP